MDISKKLNEIEYKSYQNILKGLERLSEITKPIKRVRKERKEDRNRVIETSKDFIEGTKTWSGHVEIASILAWQLYIKAQAYFDQNDVKNAQKFYNLAMKALRLSQKALERLDLEEFDKRLKRLEMEDASTNI